MEACAGGRRSGTAPPRRPGNGVDKSMVLDIRPLRTLAPAFPNPPQAPPFLSSSPFGPFPPGFSPFYPFGTAARGARGWPPYSQEQQVEETSFTAPNQGGRFQTPAAAVPLRSFGMPGTEPGAYVAGASNGDAGGSSLGIGNEKFTRTKKRPAPRVHRSNPPQKKERKQRDPLSVAALQNSALGLSPAQKEDGDRELVEYVLLKFDAVRRRLSQFDDSKEVASGITRRPDLKSGSIMLTAGIRTNARKRIGEVPGVEIGDIFFFRMELCMVGLHAPSMGGIDYMHVKGKRGIGEAISIVSSGEYEDDAEDKDVLIYTGQGGNLGIGFDMRKDKEVHDQKLVRGNLALDRSSQIGNVIRVVRGIKESVNSGTKVYVYDGLYRIHEKWLEKTKSGVNSFKYKFVRSQGQPSAFAVWQSVQMWKAGTASRPGLIFPDLTCGAESTPVSLVNDIDGEKGPSHFTYLSTVRYPNTFNLAQPFSGCSCQKECSADDLNCSCIRRNGGDFPYTTNGVLVCRKPLVYECGPSCLCSPNCKNRVSQTGLKVRLEVFKTKDKGWAVRSWDPIRSGTFICEYAGDVIDQPRFDGNEGVNYDFVFNSTHTTDRPFKWNYDAVLAGEEAQGEPNEEYNIPFSLVISAGDAGNVGRFMNHSCSANLFWQPVVYEHNSKSFVHIAFFAMRHIPPMTELTYDYGISRSERKIKRCLCRSPKCRGYFA